MAALFRKSDEKRAQEAAAQEEIVRLRALSIADLATLLLPALGPDGPTGGHSVRVQQLCQYLLRDFPGAGQLQTLQLMSRVSDALRALESAELVAPISYQRMPVWRITPRGESTLADGTTRERLT